MTAKTDTATGKVTTFSYDYRDRLTGATRKTSGGVVDYQVTYTYDALNRRIGEQIDTDGAGWYGQLDAENTRASRGCTTTKGVGNLFD